MASALLLIVMVPILKALTSAHVSATIIEQKTRSLMLAQSKLDDIRARSIYNYIGTFTKPNTPIDGLYLCSVLDILMPPSLRTIRVSVGYDQDGNGILGSNEVQVCLVTLLARRW
jgi:hypothetical protein